MPKSIKKNFLYNVLLNISSIIFPLVTSPYVARVLEPDGIGLYNFANTYANYFALVALLGMPIYGVREVAKVRDEKALLTNLISQLMTISIISTCLITAFYVLSIWIVGQLSENYIIFLLAGFAIYLAPFKINWFYQGLEEFSYITIRSLVIRTLSVICLFAFVKEKNDLIIYVIIGVLGGVLADVWNFYKMWTSGIHPQFTFRGLKSHIKPLVILSASALAVSVYTMLDTLMLGFIRDYSEVGYYNNATHITRSFLMIVTSLSLVAIPRFSYYINNKEYQMANELANKSFSFVLFLAIPLSFIMMCLAPIFVPWFWGDRFYGSILPLEILSFIIIAIGMSNISGTQILVGLGLEKLFLSSILVGAFINFILNSILIPKMGASGASIASVIAEFSITSVMVFLIHSRTPIRIAVWKDMFKSILGAVLFIPLIWLIPRIYPITIFMICYTILCTLTYLCSQYLLHNQSFFLFMESLLGVIKKRRNHL